MKDRRPMRGGEFPLLSAYFSMKPPGGTPTAEGHVPLDAGRV